jgi:hypothetical protein
VACEQGTGECAKGICVTRVCFGDCCDAVTMVPKQEGKKCGFGNHGKCTADGICVVAEEFTPSFIQKANDNNKVFSFPFFIYFLFHFSA